MFCVIGGMTMAVMDLHFKKVEGRDPIEASDVDAKLFGVRSAPVMCVDAANTAEMMFGGPGVEPVGRELVRAFQNFEILRR